VQLARGAELGHFAMGSTVILLLPPGAFAWNDAVREGGALRCGEALGAWPAGDEGRGLDYAAGACSRSHECCCGGGLRRECLCEPVQRGGWKIRGASRSCKLPITGRPAHQNETTTAAGRLGHAAASTRRWR